MVIKSSRVNFLWNSHHIVNHDLILDQMLKSPYLVIVNSAKVSERRRHRGCVCVKMSTVAPMPIGLL